MHLIRVPANEYATRYQTFDEMAKFMDLTPADRNIAWREYTSDDDWHEWPVPIHEFVRNPFYIGQNITVRPAISDFLDDFWDASQGYQLWVFIGGIGAGKSFSAALSITYALYCLACLKNPQKYLSGFPGCQISSDAEIVLMNASAAGANQGKKIVYGDTFEKITNSPWFNTYFEPSPHKTSELEFPHRIRFSPGTSNWQSVLGWNLFGFAIDEAAFGKETERADYVRELFLALNQRRRSRFGIQGFGGLFTSPGSEASFVELIADDASDWDTSIMVRRITTWDAKEELTPGVDCFLLDRDPDRVRILETDLVYVREGVVRRADGTEVEYKTVPAVGA